MAIHTQPKTDVERNGRILASAPSSLLALIGFGIAYWDYQQQTELKGAAAAELDGGEEDGI